MRCPKCGYENKEGVVVCNSCAALMPGVDSSGSPRPGWPAAGEAVPEISLEQTDLRAVCTDPQLLADFDALSGGMDGARFIRFLDYTVPRFGTGNLSRASYNLDVPAYGGVVYASASGRGHVYAEFVTPFDNGTTLTTTNAPARSWSMVKPPEHMLLVSAGASVAELLSLHVRRMAALTGSGIGPLPCPPEDYPAHVNRHYQESLSYVVSGESRAESDAPGPGCATLVLALLAGAGTVLALLLSR